MQEIEYKLYGTPMGNKKATADYSLFKTKNVDELIEFLNTNAVVPCELAPMTEEEYEERKSKGNHPAKITDFSKGYRLRNNVKEIYPWIRLDVDVKGEAKRIDKALKDIFYIKKPSTSHAKNPYKWHYFVPIENVSQNYDAYKLQYYKFLSEFKIELKDKSLAAVVQNTNPFGQGGVKLTYVNKGKVWEAPDVQAPKRKELKEKHSDMSQEKVEKLLADADPDSSYDEWLAIGMALYDWCPKRGFKLFDAWSKKSKKYDGTTQDKWDDFNRNIQGDVTIGTLIHMVHGEKKDGTEAFGVEEGTVYNLTPKEKKKILKKVKKVKKVKKAYIPRIERIEDLNIEYDPQDFPKCVRGWMLDAAKHHNLTFSATVVYMMMTASNMIGKQVELDVYGNGAWKHIPIVWGMNVGASGTGKSPLMRKLSAPNVSAQHTINKRYKYAMNKYNREMELWNNSKSSERDDIPPTKPPQPMVMMDQTTPEALYQVLEATPDGAMIWRDELADLFMSSERNESLRHPLIKSWGGESIIYHTKNSGNNTIDAPYLRIGGNIQPEVIKNIIKQHASGSKADGLFPRFGLISHLKATGYEVCRDEVNVFAREEYENRFRDLFREYRGSKAARSVETLRIDDKGIIILEKWVAAIKKDTAENTTNEHERGYLAKAPGLLASLITILHVLNMNNEKTIPSKTVVKAINIMEIAINNAYHLYGLETREEILTEIAGDHLDKWLKNNPKIFEKNGGKLSIGRIRDYNKKCSMADIKKYFESKESYKVLQQGKGFTVYG